VTTFSKFVREAVLQPQQTAQAPQQGGGVVTQQPGATRNLPLATGLVSTIQRGLAGTGLNWHSYSGGQPAKGSGGKRVGSTRHDNGRASDGYFKDAATGRVLDANNAQDRQRIAGALGKLRQAGIQGIGWGPGYMGSKNFHLDIVSPEIWGEGGRSASAHQWVIAAAGGNVAAPGAGSMPPGPDGTQPGAQTPGTQAAGGQGSGGGVDYDSPMAAWGAIDQAVGQLSNFMQGKNL
jgi:hypothetical protein